MSCSGASLVLLALAAMLSAAGAQDARPEAPSELRSAIESYLSEREEIAAARLLDAILGRPDASAENLRAAIVAINGPLTRETTLLVPYRDQLLPATILSPEGHARSGPRLPVVFDISGGEVAPWLKLDGAVVVYVKGYTPPEFSDEGRDGFLKVLRSAAHHAHGDPDRLWLCGFSWAGHASYDVALHRPSVVRGIVPMGGGPRRTWFRLLAQLAPVEVAAFCGAKDDPELVWNLREVERLAPKLKLSYKLGLDPNQGHSLPLRGMEDAARTVIETEARAKASATSGTLLADAALVESPLIRVDAVDEARVAVPARVPVSASLSPDGQRRATIDAMAAKIAKVVWKIEEKKDETIVTLMADGVTAATVFLREGAFKPGRKVTLRTGGKVTFSELLEPDQRTMAREARRTGERIRIALRTIAVKL